MADAFARALRRNPTEAEARLWSRIRRRQLAGFRFRRQVPIARYIADFACHEARLVVELDGGQHAACRDDARDATLGRHGYRVIRFWNTDVLANIDGLLAIIRKELLSPPP